MRPYILPLFMIGCSSNGLSSATGTDPSLDMADAVVQSTDMGNADLWPHSSLDLATNDMATTPTQDMATVPDLYVAPLPDLATPPDLTSIHDMTSPPDLTPLPSDMTILPHSVALGGTCNASIDCAGNSTMPTCFGPYNPCTDVFCVVPDASGNPGKCKTGTWWPPEYGPYPGCFTNQGVLSFSSTCKYCYNSFPATVQQSICM